MLMKLMSFPVILQEGEGFDTVTSAFNDSCLETAILALSLLPELPALLTISA